MPSPSAISVGIDFDNTIACYDGIFHAAALEKKLIPRGIQENKKSVRDYLRSAGAEDAWTELQGYVYGARMNDVSPFPGALECIARLKKKKIPVSIISHKTRHPYKGKDYDLHAAARKWLQDRGISMENVFLMETKEGKLEQISRCGCTHFIDDLPEFLAEPAFPPSAKKLLFSPDPAQNVFLPRDILPFQTWNEISRFLLPDDPL
ncbi:MAG TPA: hypothetical protein P5561_01420 [Candidatus Omnitrophota bacterium]|nr:hypothetical protein [Candidatus Omnitrophota bacterium]HRY85172.1 hypothetical protein [Candidatus Omnitrophota bacterium]